MNKEQVNLYRDMLHVSLGPLIDIIPREKWTKTLWRWLFAFGYIAKTLRDHWRFGKKVIIGKPTVQDKIWLLIGSKNNRDSLQFLEKALDDAIFLALNEASQTLGPYSRLSFHQAWRFWPRIPGLIKGLYPFFGSKIWRYWDEFVKAVGMEEVALKTLQKHRPKALVFSNDHTPKMRAFLWVGKKLGIPTIYIQHASISEYFPPLNFDLNLLEGEDCLLKYQQCGPIPGKVELIGMPKFDRFFPLRNTSDTVEKIGLCANIFDDIHRVERVAAQLLDNFPKCQITFRPHPRDERRFDLPAAMRRSRSDQEGIFEFLQHQDLIIAGDTSTHLEAILLNVSSIYYKFNDRYSDYYGYVKNGLVEKAQSVQDLIAKIKTIKANRPTVFQKARPYNAVVGTPNDGKSAELATRLIKDFLSQ